MKQAVAHLIPYMEIEKKEMGISEASNNGVVVLATVKGKCSFYLLRRYVL
jgi:5-methyltetrahydrofolate--homocysteine methyltransferase